MSSSKHRSEVPSSVIYLSPHPTPTLFLIGKSWERESLCTACAAAPSPAWLDWMTGRLQRWKMRRENRRRRTVSSLILNICNLYCPPSLPVFLFSHFHTFRLPPFCLTLSVCLPRSPLCMQSPACSLSAVWVYERHYMSGGNRNAVLGGVSRRALHTFHLPQMEHKWKELLKAVLKEGNPLWKRVVRVFFFFFFNKNTNTFNTLSSNIYLGMWMKTRAGF